LTPIRKWVERYKMHWVEGIFKQQLSNYDGIFKQKSCRSHLPGCTWS
jgi:hypothetical protein